MKRVVSLCIALVLISLIPFSTYAYIEDSSKSEVELVKSVENWKQGFVPFTGDETITGSEGSSTIRAAACSQFSMSYALVKMGILNPANGDTPLTHIENARRESAFRVGWGYYEFAKAPSMYDGVVYEGVDYNVSGMSGDQGLTYVKGLMDKGYYVIGIVSTPDTGGHCIFFDGINEDGTTSIGDSWFKGIKWEDYYGKTDTTWSYLELLKCRGKEFKDQPSIYSGNSLNSSVPEESVQEYRSIVKELDLKGMPVKTNLGQYASYPSYKNMDSLLQHEKDTVVSIKDSHDASKLSLSRLLGAVSAFVGIILIAYTVLLMACFILDCVNSFVDIDFVKLVTFGHIKVVKDKNDYGGGFKKGYVTIVKLFIIASVILMLGVFLVNGTILKFLYYIVGLL